MSSNDHEKSRPAEQSPYERMDEAVLLGNGEAFAEAYLDSIIGIKTEEGCDPLAVKSLGDDYVHPGENYGQYDFATDLVYVIEYRREFFMTRDQVRLREWQRDPDPITAGLAALGSAESSIKARLDRDIKEFMVKAALQLGMKQVTQPPAFSEAVEASLNRPSYDQWADPELE